uniref:Polyprotein n=1 Tax=Pink-eared duck calicivirus I TaxID=2592509 RepID=A0A5B8KAK9_9CALI|nr:polyprotein [Pink-eared duck calicivirus I]
MASFAEKRAEYVDECSTKVATSTRGNAPSTSRPKRRFDDLGIVPDCPHAQKACRTRPDILRLDPDQYMQALEALGCHTCAAVYTQTSQHCEKHSKRDKPYIYASRLAARDHDRTCKAWSQDPLADIPNTEFWTSVFNIFDQHTHCLTCAATYAAAYFRKGTSFEEWRKYLPRVFQLRRHAPTCTVCPDDFELQGAGNSTARTIPRTRAGGYSRVARELSGPNEKPDPDLTAQIMSVLAAPDTTPAQVLKLVEDSITNGSKAPPRATLATVWRNLGNEDAPDRAAAILTAVTLWLADNDALNSAELNSLRPLRRPVTHNWVQTLKQSVSNIETWFVSRKLGTHLRTVMELLTSLLQTFAEGHQSIDALLHAAKPIPLMALALTFDGTPLGFATYIMGVLQLYGLLDAEMIAGAAAAITDALTAFATKVFAMLSPFGDEAQAQSAASIAVCTGAMIVVWLIGHLPNAINQELRRAAATATSLLAVFKVAKLAFDLARKHITSRHVNSLTDRVLDASIEVVRPAANSCAATRRNQLRNLKAIQEEITSHMVKLDYAPHLPTLKALNATLTGLIIRLNQIEGQGTSREPPVGVVLCGPPGIGKTTLATWILDQIAPNTVHSNFTMQVDHADAYTGEITCLWDEFDTDANMSFIEGVIGIFNKTAYPLNCDLAENKGRVWASRVVAMTTNTATPVSPDSTRAHAFYRRLIFYDVSSPTIDKFMHDNPGIDPPASLFKDDFSHLRITRRPYLAYTPQGDTLEGYRARPINCTPKAIVKEIIARLGPDFEPQSGPDQTIGIIIPEQFAADARTQLLHAFSTNNSFVKLVEARGPLRVEDLHNPRGGHVIVTAGAEDPAVKNWYVCTTVNQAASDLNTMFGLCPKLPHDVNRHFRTRLFQTIVHAGARPPSALPTQQHFECKRLGDYLHVLHQVYGSQMLPIIARLASRLTIKSWTAFFSSLADLTWGHGFHSYSLKTDAGVFYVYTQEYMSVFSVCDPDHCVDTSSAPPVSSMTIWEMFKAICKSICTILASHLNTAATVTAITYYSRLVRAQPQAGPNPRGMVRNYQAGIALSDEEYNTWREYNTRVDPRATVSDFITARDSLLNNQVIATERIASLARWLQARNSPNLGVFEAQSGNYFDYCGRLRKEDGTTVGWAIHIGNGRWIGNTHAFEDAVRIDDTPFEWLKRGEADVSTVTAHTIPHCAQLGQGPPVRSWDSRPTHSVIEHTLDKGYIRAVGWLAHLNGGTYIGDCGLPYFNTVGQVCGIHSGFFRGSRQVVISKVQSFNPPPTTWRGIPVENSGLMLGPLRKGTSFSRSVAHPTKNAWEDYEPAPYGGNDPRNCMTQERILANQLTPYIQAPPPMHPIVEEAARYVKRHLATILSFAPVPTMEPFALALKRLDLGTTCGPFVPGIKRDYFALTPSGPELKPGTELTRHLDSTMAIAGTGRPIPNAYQLALKDELLPSRKIKESRKRLLWGTDVGLTTLAAMVWGRLLDSLKSIVVASPISVGCQMDSTFVATIVSQIQDKHTLCLDYKKWDSTMHPEVIHHAVDILCDLVPESPYRESLRLTLHQNPVGYFMDKKVTALRGLPSGTPATSVINSVCHCIYFTAANWLSQDLMGVARDRAPLENNRIWTYGDDCIYALSPRNASLMTSFIEALKTLGLTPTAADKTENFLLDSDIQFLKRDIVPLENLVVARLDLHSILRQAVWVNSSVTDDHTKPRMPKDTSARTVQIQEALLALALHGPETYSTWKHLFHETIVGEGLPCEVDDWETQIMLYRTRYITADPYSNTMLAEGDFSTDLPENEFEFQSGNRDELPSDGGATGAVATDQAGITTAYTPTQAVAGTAGAPVGESLALSTMGAGLPNTLPSGVQGLFVTTTRFNWNTTQPPRQMIGLIKLSPENNPFLKLLSRMYVGWSGGMLVRIQISGSGMYGGRLIASVLPPGIDAAQVANPTAYPYAIIDARVPEPIQLELTDIRTTAYHLVGDDNPATTSLAIYVSSPLINPFGSSTGQTSAVEVTVYTTPSPDFTFLLMKEPTSETIITSRMLGSSTAEWKCNRTGRPITSFRTAGTMRYAWNVYDPNGYTTGWGNARVNQPISFEFAQNPWNASANQTVCRVNFIWREGHDWIMQDIDPALPDFIYHEDRTDNDNQTSEEEWASLSGPVYYGTGLGPGFVALNDQYPLGWKFLSMYIVGGGQDSSNMQNIRGVGEISKDHVFAIPIGRLDPTGNDTYENKGAYGMGLYTVGSSTFSFDPITTAACKRQYAPTGNSFVEFLAPNPVWANTLRPSPRATGGIPARNVMCPSAQPLCMSEYCRDFPSVMGPDTLAIYRLDNGTHAFEIGVRADGYIMTGGDSGHTIELTPYPYEISFAGYSNSKVRLMAPTSRPAARRH